MFPRELTTVFLFLVRHRFPKHLSAMQVSRGDKW